MKRATLQDVRESILKSKKQTTSQKDYLRQYSRNAAISIKVGKQASDR